MLVKTNIRKFIFGQINEDIINLDESKVYDVSFCPSTFREDEDGYYSDDEYMSLYFEDLGIYLTFSIEICYSYVERYDPGDYFNPPDYEIVHEDLEVVTFDATIEDEEGNAIDFEHENVYTKLNEFVENYIDENF
jgi:hypothetical protein